MNDVNPPQPPPVHRPPAHKSPRRAVIENAAQTRGNAKAGPGAATALSKVSAAQQSAQLMIFFVLERFAAFIDDERHDSQCRDGISPPPSEGSV
jgi:hypothetical protein